MSDDLFKGKSVTVTGGTGSFGHFIVRELLRFEIREILIFSRDEEKQLDMMREFTDPRLKFVIGDVRDKGRLLERVHTDYLYHAAALKIVPTCEECPVEAIKTNLLGTLNVKETCIRNGVRKAIFISTDKAVKPVNTYGMTKALAEKVWVDQQASSESLFSVVRYGNVVGSRGSVVPFFGDLIKKGRPLPITHTAMSRFLLTLRQAIALVFYATQNMSGGEIYVPKNPACRVLDLVESLGGKGYPTEDIGIRPGEKIAETLISEEEARRVEERETCFIIHQHGRYKSKKEMGEFTSDTARQLGVQEIRQLLKEAQS